MDIRKISNRIEQQTEPESFSGVVYLAQGGKMLFAEGYGMAIRSEAIPNRITTRFQMASGCKVFTSVAVCQLVERGVLTFDTRLCDCVDALFPHYDPGITVHHLLTHSSGITSYFKEDVNDDYEALWQTLPMYGIRRPRDFLPLFQHEPMKFSPGARFEYNDGGYILLGLILEAVTGMCFSDYIQQHVFERAGMVDSGYFATDQLPARTAYAYIRNPDGSWRTNFFAVPIVGAPDGGAYTTAPDMARFWQALLRGRLLGREVTDVLLKAQICTGWNAPYTHYGYGLWIEMAGKTVRKYFVEGFDPGVALRSTVYPDRDIVLTLIGNTQDALWSLWSALEEVLEDG
jgi:CubicO group peptidase (beta-lactamase class C family)